MDKTYMVWCVKRLKIKLFPDKVFTCMFLSCTINRFDIRKIDWKSYGDVIVASSCIEGTASQKIAILAYITGFIVWWV